DWLENGYEKNTIKLKSSALRYLNTYIFSYLVWFKENIDADLKIPKDIETFDPNIFVRRTHSYMMKVSPNVVLPITFPEFLERASDIGVASGKVNSNTLASRQRDILNFFESCKQ